MYSSRSITRLPRMCPHFFGQTWSSRKQPAAPGGDQLVDRADDVQRVAVAGVGVDDDRDRHAPADPAGPLDDLRLREQPQVRLADGGGRDGVAGDEAHRETRRAGRSSPRACRTRRGTRPSRCCARTWWTRVFMGGIVPPGREGSIGGSQVREGRGQTILQEGFRPGRAPALNRRTGSSDIATGKMGSRVRVFPTLIQATSDGLRFSNCLTRPFPRPMLASCNHCYTQLTLARMRLRRTRTPVPLAARRPAAGDVVHPAAGPAASLAPAVGAAVSHALPARPDAQGEPVGGGRALGRDVADGVADGVEPRGQGAGGAKALFRRPPADVAATDHEGPAGLRGGAAGNAAEPGDGNREAERCPSARRSPKRCGCSASFTANDPAIRQG